MKLPGRHGTELNLLVAGEKLARPETSPHTVSRQLGMAVLAGALCPSHPPPVYLVGRGAPSGQRRWA